ncbi:VOC family protein [Nocardioides solisilvae]|uniref:VOC family protein n=1 Tax=Nocardioides solisilvae TaxID=1542435 RepID=UPI000D746D0F|nr:VOC family protein [Nocardioides solisilvae]
MSGRVVHFEVPYDDHDRATAFYREIFGWDVSRWDDFEYDMVSTGPQGEQGPTEPGYIGGGMFRRDGELNAPVVTMGVDDIDATLAQVEAAGGSTVSGKEPVGEMGWSAYFRDCEGNLMGLWQSASPEG